MSKPSCSFYNTRVWHHRSNGPPQYSQTLSKASQVWGFHCDDSIGDRAVDYVAQWVSDWDCGLVRVTGLLQNWWFIHPRYSRPGARAILRPYPTNFQYAPPQIWIFLGDANPVNLSECQTDLSGLSLFEGLEMNRILRARIQQQGKSTQNAERADSSVNTIQCIVYIV